MLSSTPTLTLPSPAVAVRNLVTSARYADLCTTMSRMHHRRAGYPVGSLVDFATDAMGHPLFSLSPLAMHTRNVLEEPRCSLVVQMPGWQGLANARVTLFGDVHMLPDELQAPAREVFRRKHQPSQVGYGTSEFPLYRMNTIRDIYFVGGFGTVEWIDPADYTNARPHSIVGDVESVDEVLQRINDRFADSLVTCFEDAERVHVISIDQDGIDVRVRQGGSSRAVQRILFEGPVLTVEDAFAAIDAMITCDGKSE